MKTFARSLIVVMVFALCGNVAAFADTDKTALEIVYDVTIFLPDNDEFHGGRKSKTSLVTSIYVDENWWYQEIIDESFVVGDNTTFIKHLIKRMWDGEFYRMGIEELDPVELDDGIIRIPYHRLQKQVEPALWDPHPFLGFSGEICETYAEWGLVSVSDGIERFRFLCVDCPTCESGGYVYKDTSLPGAPIVRIDGFHNEKHKSVREFLDYDISEDGISFPRTIISRPTREDDARRITINVHSVSKITGFSTEGYSVNPPPDATFRIVEF